MIAKSDNHICCHNQISSVQLITEVSFTYYLVLATCDTSFCEDLDSSHRNRTANDHQMTGVQNPPTKGKK